MAKDQRKPGDESRPPEPIRQRVATWLHTHRWALCIFLAALAVRLHWNLSAHPIGEFIYSDMQGYNGRADQIIDKTFYRGEYRGFFPFGTQFLLAAVKVAFGKTNFVAIGVYQALLGSLTVVMSYWVACRASRHRWVPRAVGLFMIFYYPLISLGGYMLSETPASFFMVASSLLLLRLVQEGRDRDAWLLGATVALGALVRPQLLVTAGLVFLFWTAWRGQYPRVRLGHFVRAGIPMLLALSFASGRLYWHTGRRGLVSENAAVNLTFGRCHNKGIYSLPDGQPGHGRIRFSPPPLIQLEGYSKKYPERLLSLDPVFGDHPEPVAGVEGFEVDGYGCRHRRCQVPGGEISFVGYMGDREPLGKITRACIRRAGLKRQLWFSFTHVVQLWAVNDMWPDQANPKPRPASPRWGWDQLTRLWRYVHNALIMVPALLGLGFAFAPRKRPELALVALNFWALLLIVAVFIGGIRFRVPYDPFLIILAAEIWALIAGLIVTRVRGRAASSREAHGQNRPEP